ncbi:hypothetical protein IF2G_04681 [Cordyceps javanica]|nr:hypothetical protein IF2G_04681 [Cordyceps javanica]
MYKSACFGGLVACNPLVRLLLHRDGGICASLLLSEQVSLTQPEPGHPPRDSQAMSLTGPSAACMQPLWRVGGDEEERAQRSVDAFARWFTYCFF